MAQRFNWNNLESATVAQLLDSHSPDSHGFGETYRELITRLEAEAPHEVVLDFSSVHSISSSGLRRLLKLKEKVASGGGSLTLSNVGDRVHEVFSLARLARYFGLQQNSKLRRTG
jgi:anti-anti-sigma factor